MDGQRKMLTKYAKENGFSNTRFYVDDGITGTRFDRPGFQAMLDDIEMGYVSTVIVKDLSRLGRDYVTVGQYTDIYFPDHNVRFIAINSRKIGNAICSATCFTAPIADGNYGLTLSMIRKIYRSLCAAIIMATGELAARPIISEPTLLSRW